MLRINVDIDDQACAEVMRRYQLATKSEAINFTLRTLAAEAASLEAMSVREAAAGAAAAELGSVKEARALRGIGWEGDLDAMRSSRSA